jgi:opacity protein-like surface antigen
VVLAAIPAAGAAQARRGSSPMVFGAGVRGGHDFENDAWSSGAQASIPLFQRFELRPSGDWYFGDETPFRWQLNADGAIRFGPGGTVYAGGGAAFARVRALGDVKIGYNLLVGIVPARPGAKLRPFIEGRWTWVNDVSPFRLVAGFDKIF